MPKQHFACKVEVLLQNFWFFMMCRKLSPKLTKLLIYLVKNVGPGLRLIVSKLVHVGNSRFHIQLHRGNTCSILTSVSLFLHEEIHLVEAPKGGTVLFLVVIKGLEKADHPDSAFMLDEFAH